jgi:predicted RND superfamily exporter protein
MKRGFLSSLEQAVFGHRPLVLAAFGLATLFLGYKTTGLHIDAGFEKLLPAKHPYIRTFMKHQQEFGGANRLLVAVRANEGDIFTPEFFGAIKDVTNEVFFLPGVNRSTVQSIFTPNTRFIEIVEGGFSGGNVVPADFTATPQRLAEVRENIIKAGIVGRLVSNDFTAALVSAQLVEIDPTSGERLDYLKVADELEEKIRDRHRSGNVDIHIIGFAKVMGDIADGAAGVVSFFVIALFVSAILVYFLTHSVKLTIYPLLCSVIAVVWNLGLLTWFGFGLDPMALLVPFLVFAIGVSHGVQMVNAVGAECYKGATGRASAQRAFRRLVTPGGVALATDTIGFLTLLLIEVRIIQELAITASLGVAVIILTNLFLLPVLLSYVTFDEACRVRLSRSAERKERAWQVLSKAATAPVSVMCLLLAVVLAIYGFSEGRKLQIGDLHSGVPELRPNSRYNRDAAMITDRFSIGLDILTTIVETIPDACVEHDIMDRIDRFQWHMTNVPGVQSALSLPQLARIINAGWSEGHLKWRILPRNPQVLAQAISPVETSTGLLNADCSVMPVMIFLEDHKAKTIERVVDAVKAFAAENDSDRHRFRLATGNVGVMAATNEVVRAAQVRMLIYIFTAVFVLCLVTFRSWRPAVCIVLPLGLVSVLCYALMSLLEIGLKTSTLPVAALGVGIGVDYGIYIFSRLKRGLENGLPLEEAYLRTLRVTGNAVLVTGLTLAIGVCTWIFSALQFQADMGILLTFMFLANMLGAIFLLPGLAVWLVKPRRT